MIFLDILLAFILQMLFTVGAIFLFGFAIGFLRTRFYRNFGSRGRTVCTVTAFFGTPVHELSHALMCVLFGHKILEIKLFKTNADDGTLGYVKHTYNPKNVYCKIGNFFIGVAPVVCISALLFLFAYFLLPDFMTGIGALAFTPDDPAAIFVSLGGVIGSFFIGATEWRWWVFVIVGIPFAMHMAMSKKDLEGALSGLVLLFAVFFAVDLILGLVSAELLSAFTNAMLGVGGYLICILTVGLIISAIAWLLSFLIKKLFLRG